MYLRTFGLSVCSRFNRFYINTTYLHNQCSMNRILSCGESMITTNENILNFSLLYYKRTKNNTKHIGRHVLQILQFLPFSPKLGEIPISDRPKVANKSLNDQTIQTV